MSKIVLLILLLTALAGASGCNSAAGSREFIPGRGWKTNGWSHRQKVFQQAALLKTVSPPTVAEANKKSREPRRFAGF